MAYNVRKTEPFIWDEEESFEYIFLALKSPQAADGLLDAIEHAQGTLSLNPFMNAVSQKPLLRCQGFREHFIKKYVIVYKVHGDTVYLMRLFH